MKGDSANHNKRRKLDSLAEELSSWLHRWSSPGLRWLTVSKRQKRDKLGFLFLIIGQMLVKKKQASDSAEKNILIAMLQTTIAVLYLW